METTFLDILLNGILWWIMISVLFIAIIFMSTRSIIQKFNHKEVTKRQRDIILYLGGLSLLTGILAQVTGFISALNAIIRAADISFALVIDGLKDSFYLPCYGLIVLVFSLLAAMGLRMAGKQEE